MICSQPTTFSNHRQRIMTVNLLLVLFLGLSLCICKTTFAQTNDTEVGQVSAAAQFLSDYIKVESVSGNEAKAGIFFAEECARRGLQVRILTNENSSYNFVASLYPLSMGKPNIVLLNHIDVVDPGAPEKWTFPPFSGAIAQGAVWGRGAIDNKGMAAMQLEALCQFFRIGTQP
jgi:carboxypeptidase PM20D1